MLFSPPAPDCARCPRLAAFHALNKTRFPQGHNAPVPSFGGLEAELLIVGLAPGLKGANCTGRPFTGDYAGLVLYKALLENGLAKGEYGEKPDDGLELLNCRITNAVRCVPPENKPETAEISQCNGFLAAEIAAMPNLKLILTLGQIAHKAVLKALGYKQSHAKFAHGAVHQLAGYVLLNSYHCSRYNINTGALTPEMFDAVMKQCKNLLG